MILALEPVKFIIKLVTFIFSESRNVTNTHHIDVNVLLTYLHVPSANGGKWQTQAN